MQASSSRRRLLRGALAASVGGAPLDAQSVGRIRGFDHVETSTELIVNATSLGGVTSVMESRYRWEGDRVPEGLLRFSAGLEDASALWADLARALDAT